MIAAAPQALKSSKEVELLDDKIRCKTEPERWPIPTPAVVGSPRTDFSQLINCPEFVPRQTLGSSNSGQYAAPVPQTATLGPAPAVDRRSACRSLSGFWRLTEGSINMSAQHVGDTLCRFNVNWK